jgi:hypothetical protein
MSLRNLCFGKQLGLNFVIEWFMVIFSCCRFCKEQ